MVDVNKELEFKTSGYWTVTLTSLPDQSKMYWIY